MERLEYLKKCQKCAVLKEFGQIKQNVPNELKVTANDIVYYPVAYELRFDKQGNPIHTAVLHDLKARSVTYCPLEGVKEHG